MKTLIVAGALACICCVAALSFIGLGDPVKEVTFAAEGMTCPSCATGLQLMVAGVDGVESAEVDYDESVVIVTYDSRETDPSSIEESVEAVGGYDLAIVEEGVSP